MTNSPGVDECDPAFSPDGQHIVYSADAYTDPYSSFELWTIDRNGGSRTLFMSDIQYVDEDFDGIGDVPIYHSFITPRWHGSNLTGTNGGSIAFSFASEMDASWSIELPVMAVLTFFTSLHQTANLMM